MSVATQLFAPDYDDQVGEALPRRAHLRAVPLDAPGHVHPVRSRRTPAVTTSTPSASVSVLLAPEPEAVPLRLTRRGLTLVALLVAALGALLVWLAALSAPSDAASGTAPGGAAPAGTAAVVTVRPGDTLWSIAGRVAPTVDPRAEVDHLRRVNHLDDVALVPGQQLHVR